MPKELVLTLPSPCDCIKPTFEVELLCRMIASGKFTVACDHTNIRIRENHGSLRLKHCFKDGFLERLEEKLDITNRVEDFTEPPESLDDECRRLLKREFGLLRY